VGLIHKHAPRLVVRAAWSRADDVAKARARKIIDDRSSLRSRSVSATLVFMGFLIGVQGAIVVCGITSSDTVLRAAIKPTILAILVLFVGMFPSWGNLFPRYRNAEALEALGMDEGDAFNEAANRSSTQRTQLWRLRAAMAVSFLFTGATLYKLFVFL
jgi:hypothetical protein